MSPSATPRRGGPPTSARKSLGASLSGRLIHGFMPLSPRSSASRGTLRCAAAAAARTCLAAPRPSSWG
eukprot:15460281-Alexandrium_andersonii.AAC.1